MTYLVDANLLCEPTKSQASQRACEWLERNDIEIVIDAVVLGEIWDGIAALPNGRKRLGLEDWFPGSGDPLRACPGRTTRQLSGVIFARMSAIGVLRLRSRTR